MLEQLGLIKYNKRFILDNNNININPIYSPKSNKISNYFNSNQKNNNSNTRNKSKKERKNLSLNNNKKNKKEYTKKIDEIFFNNLKLFISEASHEIKNNNNIKDSLIKINHDIDEKKNTGNNNFFMTFGRPNNYSKKTKKKKNSKNEMNKNITKDIDNINNINKYFDIDREINKKKEKVKQLIINNDAIMNKIKLVKDEYNNNLKNRSEMDKNFNNNLFNSKNLKVDKNIVDNDILSLKENIIELKNKLSIINKEQSSLNLMLFKEKIENDLNKEDIIKMNKLIGALNQDIENLKNEIALIRNKNKQLQLNQNNNSSNDK